MTKVTDQQIAAVMSMRLLNGSGTLVVMLIRLPEDNAFKMTVEQVFQVEIADEDAERLTTAGETQAYLQDQRVL